MITLSCINIIIHFKQSPQWFLSIVVSLINDLSSGNIIFQMNYFQLISMCTVSIITTGKICWFCIFLLKYRTMHKTGMEGMCIRGQWLHCTCYFRKQSLYTPQYWLMHSFEPRPLWWWHITWPSIKWELTKQN